jgi:hypothetical protein
MFAIGYKKKRLERIRNIATGNRLRVMNRANLRVVVSRGSWGCPSAIFYFLDAIQSIRWIPLSPEQNEVGGRTMSR